MKRKVMDYTVYIGITLLCISVGTGTLAFSMSDAAQQTRYKNVTDKSTIVKAGIEVGEGIAETSDSKSDDISEERGELNSEIRQMIQNDKPMIKDYLMMFLASFESDIISFDDEVEKKRLDLPMNVSLDVDEYGVYNIQTDAYNIRFSEEEYKKKKGDMNIIEAVDKAKADTEMFLGRSIDCKKISACLLKEEDIVSIGEYEVEGSMYSKSDNAGENYGQYYYEINFQMENQSAYSVHISTVTGEILRIIYFNTEKTPIQEKDDIVYFDYTELDEVGYEIYKSKLEKVQDYYMESAINFIEKTFTENGTVSILGCIPGEMITIEQGRFVMTVFCKIESGKTYGIIFDQADKSVCGYEINPRLY